MIIGLTGYAQNGKDTAGARLVAAHGYTRFAFADALKSMALALDPIILNTEGTGEYRLSRLVEHQGWEGAKLYSEVRRFLQVLGTEGVRDHLGTNSWVQALEKQLVDAGIVYIYDDPMMTSGAFDVRGDAVITDVRFPNEAKWVKDRAGLMVRVVRLNEDGTEFDNGLGKDHPSEALIASLPVDYTLHATSVEDLESFVDALKAWVAGVTV